MCFSAQASFMSAAIISIVGVLSLVKARNSKIYVFAAGPIVFGIQQTLEGIVWLTLNRGDSVSILHKAAVLGFILIAGVVWPVGIPGSLFILEQDRVRKKILLIFLFLGSCVAIMSLLNLIFNGMGAEINNHHISYNYISPYFSSVYMYYLEQVLIGVYVVATIGALFTSSVYGVWVLGIIAAVAFVVAQIFYKMSFGSVWCFFAAACSVAVYYIVTKYNQKYITK